MRIADWRLGVIVLFLRIASKFENVGLKTQALMNLDKRVFNKEIKHG